MLAQVFEGKPIHKEPVEKLLETRWATGLTWFLPHGLLMLGRHEPLAKRDTSTQLAAVHGVSVPCRSLECVCVSYFCGHPFWEWLRRETKRKAAVFAPNLHSVSSLGVKKTPVPLDRARPRTASARCRPGSVQMRPALKSRRATMGGVHSVPNGFRAVQRTTG